MKKVLKILGLTFLVLVGLVAALFIKGALTPAVPKGYTKTVKTGGEIEQTYLKNGSFETARFEQKTDEDFENFEMNLVIPTEAMHDMYQKLNAPKVMARKRECEHGEMLYSADGYVTAWMMWQLQGDENAARAFTGETPELLSNPLYQEQQCHIPE